MFNLDVFDEILKLHVGVAQPDNDKMFELLGKLLPLRLRKFKTGSEHNGWVIPDECTVEKAIIKKNSRTIFDGKAHPLAVISYSDSFRGTISKEELDQHISYREDMPSAYNFHSSNVYRPWAKKWGFCVPYEIWKTWGNGSYEVELVTRYRPSYMKVAECHIPGKVEETIILNAHTCHPAQFNDGFAGVSLIIALCNWLRSKKRRYSYRAIFGPEHLGTVFYIAKLSAADLKRLKAAMFIEMIGIDNHFALQESFTGKSVLDQAARNSLSTFDSGLRIGPFRSILGNDETVWEAPGVEIPCISISRCADSPHYYPQYHTEQDNLDLNSESKMREAFEACKDIIETLEDNRVIKRKFKGLVALSNPKYDLYVQRIEPGIRKDLTADDLKLGPMQDLIVRYFDGNYSLLDLSEKFSIPFKFMRDYIEGFREKGLVELKPCSLGAMAGNKRSRR